jgi:DNA-directed RNA polymerase subunit M/transcription elongation factor TFIIS
MMKCKTCGSALEIARSCGSVKMRCTGCDRRFAIHEVVDQLDEKTESKLAGYPVIIYD